MDDSDYESLSQYKWECRKHINVKRRIYSGRNHYTVMYMHRQILNAETGVMVDHKDRNALNNQRENLRLATASQNQCNRGKPRHSASPYKCVYYRASRNKWEARIKINKKRIALGCFETAEMAWEAYKRASEKYHGDFACTSTE